MPFCAPRSPAAVTSVLAIGGIGGLAIGLAGREICENILNGFLIMSTVRSTSFPSCRPAVPPCCLLLCYDNHTTAHQATHFPSLN